MEGDQWAVCRVRNADIRRANLLQEHLNWSMVDGHLERSFAVNFNTLRRSQTADGADWISGQLGGFGHAGNDVGFTLVHGDHHVVGHELIDELVRTRVGFSASHQRAGIDGDYSNLLDS